MLAATTTTEATAATLQYAKRPDRCSGYRRHPVLTADDAGSQNRDSFTSVADLTRKILDVIAYYNRTMARPFGWTSQGKPLVA